MKSIKWKLIAIYLGLVLMVMIASGTYILLSTQNIEINKSKEQLKTYADIIEEQVVLSYEETSFQYGLEQFSQKNSNSTQVHGNILNSDGITLASTLVSKPPFPQFKNSSVISAMAGTDNFEKSEISSDSNGILKEWISFAKPVKINGEVKYIVYTQIDASPMNESLAQTKQIIILSVFLAFVLTIILGYILAKTLTDPILTLTSKAKEMASGNLNIKIKVQSSDEIGQLTSSFNYMASELSKNMLEISKEKNKLEIILHNMSDGVISFDKNGILIHANTASLELLDKEEFSFTLAEFLNEYKIDTTDILFDNAKQMILPINDKFLNANFSYYKNEKEEIEGLVVVLQDITEQKKLDDMRKEFVANVSHELRTPLTTVKSYTETLLEGAIDEHETAVEFLKIINCEADRMAFLVRDLLQLSRFDNKQILFEMNDINVNEFVNENVRQCKIHAENKRQTLIFEAPMDNVCIYADRSRITQVLNNILTNAIKYSQEEAEIKVMVANDENYVKIIVKDNGMGIQKEDLSRIFERFFRVDKARSRSMGGTGLGLAIAKEIMEAHKGKITAESEYGKGTTMTLWFLKNLKQTIPMEI